MHMDCSLTRVLADGWKGHTDSAPLLIPCLTPEQCNWSDPLIKLIAFLEISLIPSDSQGVAHVSGCSRGPFFAFQLLFNSMYEYLRTFEAVCLVWQTLAVSKVPAEGFLLQVLHTPRVMRKGQGKGAYKGKGVAHLLLELLQLLLLLLAHLAGRGLSSRILTSRRERKREGGGGGRGGGSSKNGPFKAGAN